MPVPKFREWSLEQGFDIDKILKDTTPSEDTQDESTARTRRLSKNYPPQDQDAYPPEYWLSRKPTAAGNIAGKMG